MDKKQTNAVFEYRAKLSEYGFRQKQDCTEEENARYLEMIKNGETVPDNVGRYLDENEQPTDNFYIIINDDMTHEQRMEFLAMKQQEELVSIRKCMVFFTVITILGLIGAFLLRIFY
ncbi:MAG: hypothetical protein ACI4JT_07720 [Oscillospiraceae bacterium]